MNKKLLVLLLAVCICALLAPAMALAAETEIHEGSYNGATLTISCNSAGEREDDETANTVDEIYLVKDKPISLQIDATFDDMVDSAQLIDVLEEHVSSYEYESYAKLKKIQWYKTVTWVQQYDSPLTTLEGVTTGGRFSYLVDDEELQEIAAEFESAWSNEYVKDAILQDPNLSIKFHAELIFALSNSENYEPDATRYLILRTNPTEKAYTYSNSTSIDTANSICIIYHPNFANQDEIYTEYYYQSYNIELPTSDSALILDIASNLPNDYAGATFNGWCYDSTLNEQVNSIEDEAISGLSRGDTLELWANWGVDTTEQPVLVYFHSYDDYDNYKYSLDFPPLSYASDYTYTAGAYEDYFYALDENKVFLYWECVQDSNYNLYPGQEMSLIQGTLPRTLVIDYAPVVVDKPTIEVSGGENGVYTLTPKVTTTLTQDYGLTDPYTGTLSFTMNGSSSTDTFNERGDTIASYTLDLSKSFVTTTCKASVSYTGSETLSQASLESDSLTLVPLVYKDPEGAVISYDLNEQGEKVSLTSADNIEGWKDVNGNLLTGSITASEPLELTAVYKHTVSFESDREVASNPANQYVPSAGGTITLPAPSTPTDSGYFFIAWGLESSADAYGVPTEWFEAGDVVEINEDTTFIAHYNSPVATWTVYVRDVDGKLAENKITTVDVTITARKGTAKLPDGTYAGVQFTNGQHVIEDVPVGGSVYLSQGNSIGFGINGVTYTFTGEDFSTLDIACEPESGTPESGLTMSIYMDYEDATPYTVTFDPGDIGSGTMEALEIPAGDYTLPENAYTYDSALYGFVGWDVDGKTYAPGDTIYVSENFTATAVWEQYVGDLILTLGPVNEYDLYSVNATVNYYVVLTGADGEPLVLKEFTLEHSTKGTSTYTTAANGVVGVSLTREAGDTLRIHDIPAGTKAYVCIPSLILQNRNCIYNFPYVEDLTPPSSIDLQTTGLQASQVTIKKDVEHTLELTYQSKPTSLTVDLTGGRDAYPDDEFDVKIAYTETSLAGTFNSTRTAADTTTEETVQIADGVATLQMKAGESITISGLPAGVTADVSAAKDFYSFTNSPATVSFTGSAGPVLNTAIEKTASFVATYVPPELDLTVGVADTRGLLGDSEVKLTVTLTDATNAGTFSETLGEVAFTDGVAELTLTPGETVTIPGLTEGMEYTVAVTTVNGENLTLPTDPTEWFNVTDASTATINGTVSQTYYDAKTLTLDYNPSYYLATFETDGASELEARKSASMDPENVILPDASEVTKAGYVLLNWKSDAGVEYDPGETVELTKDTTFTAVWQQLTGDLSISTNASGLYPPDAVLELTITVDGASGTYALDYDNDPETMAESSVSFDNGIATIEVPFGVDWRIADLPVGAYTITATAPDNFTDAGSSELSGTINEYTPSWATLAYTYSAVYTISFEPGDGASGTIASRTISSDQLASPDVNDPTLMLPSFEEVAQAFTREDGMRFAGWAVKGDETKQLHIDGNVMAPLYEDTTFVAQWSNESFTVTVTPGYKYELDGTLTALDGETYTFETYVDENGDERPYYLGDYFANPVKVDDPDAEKSYTSPEGMALEKWFITVPGAANSVESRNDSGNDYIHGDTLVYPVYNFIVEFDLVYGEGIDPKHVSDHASGANYDFTDDRCFSTDGQGNIHTGWFLDYDGDGSYDAKYENPVDSKVDPNQSFEGDLLITNYFVENKSNYHITMADMTETENKVTALWEPGVVVTYTDVYNEKDFSYQQFYRVGGTEMANGITVLDPDACFGSHSDWSIGNRVFQYWTNTADESDIAQYKPETVISTESITEATAYTFEMHYTDSPFELQITEGETPYTGAGNTLTVETGSDHTFIAGYIDGSTIPTTDGANYPYLWQVKPVSEGQIVDESNFFLSYEGSESITLGEIESELALRTGTYAEYDWLLSLNLKNPEDETTVEHGGASILLSITEYVEYTLAIDAMRNGELFEEEYFEKGDEISFVPSISPEVEGVKWHWTIVDSEGNTIEYEEQHDTLTLAYLENLDSDCNDWSITVFAKKDDETLAYAPFDVTFNPYSYSSQITAYDAEGNEIEDLDSSELSSEDTVTFKATLNKETTEDYQWHWRAYGGDVEMYYDIPETGAEIDLQTILDLNSNETGWSLYAYAEKPVEGEEAEQISTESYIYFYVPYTGDFFVSIDEYINEGNFDWVGVEPGEILLNREFEYGFTPRYQGTPADFDEVFFPKWTVIPLDENGEAIEGASASFTQDDWRIEITAADIDAVSETYKTESHMLWRLELSIVNSEDVEYSPTDAEYRAAVEFDISDPFGIQIYADDLDEYFGSDVSGIVEVNKNTYFYPYMYGAPEDGNYHLPKWTFIPLDENGAPVDGVSFDLIYPEVSLEWNSTGSYVWLENIQNEAADTDYADCVRWRLKLNVADDSGNVYEDGTTEDDWAYIDVYYSNLDDSTPDEPTLDVLMVVTNKENSDIYYTEGMLRYIEAEQPLSLTATAYVSGEVLEGAAYAWTATGYNADNEAIATLDGSEQDFSLTQDFVNQYADVTCWQITAQTDYYSEADGTTIPVSATFVVEETADVKIIHPTTTAYLETLAGTDVNLKMTAINADSYQWWSRSSDGVDTVLTGQTASTLTLENVGFGQGGIFYCVVTGQQNDQTVTLNDSSSEDQVLFDVIVCANISVPETITIAEDGSATLYIEGIEPDGYTYTYSWVAAATDTVISGETPLAAPTFVLTNAAAGEHYHCVAYLDEYGEVANSHLIELVEDTAGSDPETAGITVTINGTPYANNDSVTGLKPNESITIQAEATGTIADYVVSYTVNGETQTPNDDGVLTYTPEAVGDYTLTVTAAQAQAVMSLSDPVENEDGSYTATITLSVSEESSTDPDEPVDPEEPATGNRVILDLDPATADVLDSHSFTITGEAKTEEPTVYTTYYVELVWGDMAFKWMAPSDSTKIWQTDDHTYEYTEGSTQTGYWDMVNDVDITGSLLDGRGSATGDQATVLVFNHSNAPVDATIAIADKGVAEIKSTLEKDTNGAASPASESDQSITYSLPAAVENDLDTFDDTTSSVYDSTTTAKVQVKLSDPSNVTEIASTTVVATLTVTLEEP